jgi:hypothetical protein
MTKIVPVVCDRAECGKVFPRAESWLRNASKHFCSRECAGLYKLGRPAAPHAAVPRRAGKAGVPEPWLTPYPRAPQVRKYEMHKHSANQATIRALEAAIATQQAHAEAIDAWLHGVQPMKHPKEPECALD